MMSALNKAFRSITDALSLTAHLQDTRAPEEELRDSFSYLKTISPDRANKMLEALGCTVGTNIDNYHCPSEFSGKNTEKFRQRIEFAISDAERAHKQSALDQRNFTPSS